MTRESMTFYADWLKAVQSLPKAMQADVLLAILEYGLNGVDTCSEGSIESTILAFIKPQIDINNQRFENGKKGGRPRKNKNQNKTKTKPNENQNQTIVFQSPLSPSSLSPEPPITTPPISPVLTSTTTTTNAHTHEEDFAHSDEDPYGTGLCPKEKSCAKKESTLPSGTWVASADLADVLLGDERWVSDVASNKGHPIEELRKLVAEFCDNVRLTEDGKEIADAKRHFINWLRKRPKDNEQRTTQHGTRSYRNPEPDFEGIKAFVARGIASAKPPQ